MRTLHIIMFCGLFIPQLYALGQTYELTSEEKDLAKKQIIESFYKELPDSIKKLPYDSLRNNTDSYTFLIPNEIRNLYLHPQNSDNARVGYKYFTHDPRRISDIVFEGDAYSAGLVKGQCIELINGRNSEDEFELILNVDSGITLHYTLYDEVSNTYYPLSFTKNYIDEETFLSEKLGKTAIIKFEDFLNNTHTNFRRVSQQLVPESIDTLIIDVRGNSGGLVDEFNDIASEFVDKKTVLNRFKYRNHSDTTYSYQRNYGLWTHLRKIYVLIDQFSASASEMLAGFLSQLDKTEVLGTKSYGKGRMQTCFPIKTKATVHITTAEFFPGFTKIDSIGFIPKRPLKSVKEGALPGVTDIIKLRQDYTVPSIEAFQDPRLKANEHLASYIWDIRGDLFSILYKELYKK